MSCQKLWSNIGFTWSTIKETWSDLGLRATNQEIWSNISETWVCFQDTWGRQQPTPPTPIVPTNDGDYILGIVDIPMVPTVQMVEQPQKKKKKKVIELTCVVGTESFTEKKETKEDNTIFFTVKRINFEIKRLHESLVSVTT